MGSLGKNVENGSFPSLPFLCCVRGYTHLLAYANWKSMMIFGFGIFKTVFYVCITNITS